MSSPTSVPVWRRPLGWFLLSSICAGGCDLSTKGWAQQALSGRPGASMTVVEPWLDFSLAYNRGTAFSLIPDLEAARWLFAGLALVVVGILLGIALRQRPFRRGPVLMLGLIAGGAIGNGYDRAFRITPAGDTGVIDFIRVNITSSYSWPTFNLADVWLVVGVAVLVIWSFRSSADPPAAEPPTAEPALG